MAKLILGFILVFILPSCVQIQVQELEHFDQLVATPPDSTIPTMFWMEETPWTSLPALVPYAALSASSGMGKEAMARAMWKKAAALNADLCIVQEAGQTYAGSTTQFVPTGYGAFAASFPMYNTNLIAYCYKRAPFKVGYHLNDEAMLLACDEATRASGIQEGDTLLSINGLPVKASTPGANPPFHSLYFTVKPGDALQLVWIRPGTGRMDGTMAALENPPIQIELESSIPWKQSMPDSQR